MALSRLAPPRSVPPEALLLGKGAAGSVLRCVSDRQLCERPQTDLMFRWFVDLPLDQKVFDASVYSKNQERLRNHRITDVFFGEVVELARQRGWVSNEPFSV